MYKKYKKIRDILDEIMYCFKDKNKNLSIATCRLYALECAVNDNIINNYKQVNYHSKKGFYYGSLIGNDACFLVILNE